MQQKKKKYYSFNLEDPTEVNRVCSRYEKIITNNQSKLRAELSDRPVGGEQAKAQAPMGLSNSHILSQFYNPLVKGHYFKVQESRKDAKIIYYSQGQLIKVKTPWIKNGRGGSSSKRGIVKRMSYPSRLRLMRKMGQLKREEMPLFVHLTYPNPGYPSVKESKRHLTLLLQRMKRKCPKIGYIWRLEFTKKKAPHYHLFIWGAGITGKDRQNFAGWISNAWPEICDLGIFNHYLAGTTVEIIRNYRGTMHYASKYMAKADLEEQEDTGRCWGCGGKIPLDEGEEIELSRKDTFRLLRFLRRRTKQPNKGLRTFFVPNPEFWLDNQDRLIGNVVNSEK
jgi:hypothetical protein